MRDTVRSWLRIAVPAAIILVGCAGARWLPAYNDESGFPKAAAAEPAGAQPAAAPAAAVWPQWRGPTRDGVSPGADWPDSLEGDRLQQLWRVELGPGYSGPVVAADRVFVTETKGRKTEIVRALDRATGRELWSAEWPGSTTVPFFAWRNGDWIRATPACDDGRLFVAGMRDVLVCLNAADGREIWRLDFAAKYGAGLPAFGFVSSPLVDGGALYVQAGGAVCRLDKKTGEVKWRSMESRDPMMGSAFSSPVIAVLCGRRQLVAQTRDRLAGLDLETGAVLWEQPVPAFRGMNILTPTVFGDAVFTSTYQHRSFLFGISEKDGKFSSAQLWDNKVQGYMSTPVVVDRHAYMHLQNRRVACLDLKAGKETWITGDRFGEYWSLAVRNGKILALDMRGILYLLKPDPEKFVLLSERRISKDETWAHLAAADDQLFVRELNAVTAYRWK